MPRVRAGLRTHAYVLIGGLGGLPFAIAYFLWFPWAPTWEPHVRRVPADARRRVDVALSPGWYDLGLQLPGDRVVPVRGGASALIVFLSDMRRGTLTPDSYWRLDGVER